MLLFLAAVLAGDVSACFLRMRILGMFAAAARIQSGNGREFIYFMYFSVSLRGFYVMVWIESEFNTAIVSSWKVS